MRESEATDVSDLDKDQRSIPPVFVLFAFAEASRREKKIGKRGDET